MYTICVYNMCYWNDVIPSESFSAGDQSPNADRQCHKAVNFSFSSIRNVIAGFSFLL